MCKYLLLTGAQRQRMPYFHELPATTTTTPTEQENHKFAQTLKMFNFVGRNSKKQNTVYMPTQYTNLSMIRESLSVLVDVTLGYWCDERLFTIDSFFFLQFKSKRFVHQQKVKNCFLRTRVCTCVRMCWDSADKWVKKAGESEEENEKKKWTMKLVSTSNGLYIRRLWTYKTWTESRVFFFFFLFRLCVWVPTDYTRHLLTSHTLTSCYCNCVYLSCLHSIAHARTHSQHTNTHPFGTDGVWVCVRVCCTIALDAP